MNEKEILEKRNAFEKERQELQKQLESRSITNEDAKKKLKDLKFRMMSFEQEIAQAEKPKTEETRGALDLSEVRSAMLEQRAITIGAELGGQLFVKTIIEEMQSKTPVLDSVSIFTGANSRTTIPVLMPGVAEPDGYGEGEKETKLDEDAKLKALELLPHAFVSTLPVTRHTLDLGTVNFEQELPRLFAQSFKQCFHKQIFKGQGNDKKQFTGFANHTFNKDKTVTATTAGKLPVTDLVTLALSLKDRSDTACILLHPTTYSKILADSPKSDLSQVYLESLIKDKNIEGVDVIVTSHMLDDVSAGKVVAIAGELDKYGMAIAGDITITPKTKPRDTNVYYEAIMYANGQPLIDDFWALKAK